MKSVWLDATMGHRVNAAFDSCDVIPNKCPMGHFVYVIDRRRRERRRQWGAIGSTREVYVIRNSLGGWMPFKAGVQPGGHDQANNAR
jgi:hypothetical protein